MGKKSVPNTRAKTQWGGKADEGDQGLRGEKGKNKKNQKEATVNVQISDLHFSCDTTPKFEEDPRSEKGPAEEDRKLESEKSVRALALHLLFHLQRETHARHGEKTVGEGLRILKERGEQGTAGTSFINRGGAIERKGGVDREKAEMEEYGVPFYYLEISVYIRQHNGIIY